MALYVNTNVSSLNSQRQLAKSTRTLDTSYQRLASGLRINSAKDDAAGLQISDRLTTQINGLNQGNRNAQDGISFAQTVEGAMDEMTNMYQRIRTLALQSANGTNSAEDRVAIQQEVTQLCAEINRITTDTTYGGTKILTGKQSAKVDLTLDGSKSHNMTESKIDFQVGADAYQTISVNLGQVIKNEDGKEVTTTGFGVSDLGYALVLKDKDGNEIEDKGEAISSVDPDDPTKNVNSLFVEKTDDKGNAFLAFDVSNPESAQLVIRNVDSFIAAVDSKRAELGAVENRLESTIRNQSNVSENLSDARSQIRDTDFATETANMAQTSILQQASQSILSQANQRPQLAMSLLQG